VTGPVAASTSVRYAASFLRRTGPRGAPAASPLARPCPRLLPWCALLCASAAWAADEAHGSETNIFNADIGNFIFTLVIFGLVVWILSRTLWKPLLNVLNEREKTIRESLDSARREREAAARLLAEYQARLERAHAEAAALVEEGRRDAEATRQRILAQAQQETRDMTARARREIRLAADEAIKAIYDHVADLAVEVAGRVLRKQLTPADHARLIEESVAEIRATGKAKLN